MEAGAPELTGDSFLTLVTFQKDVAVKTEDVEKIEESPMTGEAVRLGVTEKIKEAA
jgi:hypothetical protein